MALYFWHCPEDNQGDRNIGLGSTEYPTCSNGNGQWIEINDAFEFSINQLDPSTIAAAFGAGFTIVGMCFVLGRTTAAILEAIRRM